MPQENIEKQNEARTYYDKFSGVYDLLSPKAYYHKARLQAVARLQLNEGDSVLNVPVGTGQNFEYLQAYLKNSGLIVGVDISSGMLKKAQRKVHQNDWKNVQLINKNVSSLSTSEVSEIVKGNGYDAVLCDLGLSGFPQWREVIDVLISMLAVNGRICIMDWYIEKPSLRGELVKWIGKGQVDRPIWQYLETKVSNFNIDSSFNRGGVFVASGTKVYEGKST